VKTGTLLEFRPRKKPEAESEDVVAFADRLVDLGAALARGDTTLDRVLEEVLTWGKG
jgi:hypothetical protein